MVFLFTTLLWGVSYCAALPITLTRNYDADSKMCQEAGMTFFSEMYHACVQSVLIECLLPIFSMSILYRKTSYELLSKNVDTQQLSSENSIKTIKWLIVLFTLIVLPGRIVHVIRSVLYYAYKQSINQEYVWLVLQLFDMYIFVNNMANVFVYCKINKNFRKYLTKKLICK